jgi:hypothetical protein
MLLKAPEGPLNSSDQTNDLPDTDRAADRSAVVDPAACAASGFGDWAADVEPVKLKIAHTEISAATERKGILVQSRRDEYLLDVQDQVGTSNVLRMFPRDVASLGTT